MNPSSSKKPSISLPLTKSGNKVQIALPSLCNYDDDDDDEEEIQPIVNKNPVKNDSKQNSADKPKSGLLSILPPPKTNPFIKPNNTNSVSSKSSDTSKPSTSSSSSFLVPRSVSSKASVDKIENSEESEGYSKKLKTSNDPQPILNKFNYKPEYVYEEDPDPQFSDEEYEAPKNESQETEETVRENESVQPKTSYQPQEQLDDQAILKLLGGNKRKQSEPIQFTDVNAKEIVGNNKAELMKQITAEYRPPSNRDYFSSSSKKKHQITYLAYVAKERDQELKATWAQNKFNRQQAKARYGF